MLIDQPGSNIYGISYLLAFLVSLVYYFHLAKVNNYPRTPWWLTIMTLTLLFLIGTRVFTYSASELTQFMTQGIVVTDAGKTAL